MKLGRFSLATLFAVVVFAGLVASLWSANHRLAQVREENIRLMYDRDVLRQEIGYLDIGDDTTRMHAIALQPGLEPLTWRWRIYVPPGAGLVLNWGFDEIANEGLHAEYTKVGAHLDEGDQVLTCAIRKDPRDGDWLLVCQSSINGSRTSVSLPSGCQPWFTEQRGGYFADVSERLDRQVTSSTSEPLVLLRQREFGPTENSNQVSSEPPDVKRDGILIWIAPREATN